MSSGVSRIITGSLFDVCLQSEARAAVSSIFFSAELTFMQFQTREIQAVNQSTTHPSIDCLSTLLGDEKSWVFYRQL
jgi:hypothetical protein